MNSSTKSSAIQAITSLINTNGPAHPSKYPQELLDHLVQELGDDPLVGALYYSCLCGIFKEAAKKNVSLESLTALIQTRCAFKKAYAGELADVLMSVYSADNLTRLKKAKNAAFEDLCGLEDWPFVWEGEKPNGPAAMASLDATGTGKPCCGWRTGRNCLLCCRRPY